MERVLARHAHRPVGLVGVPGRVGRGLVGEQLGRGDLEPRRSRFGGPRRRRQRHRDDHRLLRAVDEVRLHRLEGGDRPAELSTRRGVLERDLFQSLERARHRRGAGECAAPTQRVDVDSGSRRRDRRAASRRRSAPSRAVHRRGSPRRRCALRADRPAPPWVRHWCRAARRSRRRRAPRARGRAVPWSTPSRSTRSSRFVPGTTVTAPSGDLQTRAREEPTAEHAGLRERQRYCVTPADAHDLDGVGQRAARSAGGLRAPTPRPGRSRRPHPRWSAPSRRLRPARLPRTSQCRRTRGSRSRTAARRHRSCSRPQPLGGDGAQDLDGAAADGERRRGEDGVGEQALEQRRRVGNGLHVDERRMFSSRSCSKRVPISLTNAAWTDGCSCASIARATDNDRLRNPQNRAAADPSSSTNAMSSSAGSCSRRYCSSTR